VFFSHLNGSPINSTSTSPVSNLLSNQMSFPTQVNSVGLYQTGGPLAPYEIDGIGVEAHPRIDTPQLPQSPHSTISTPTQPTAPYEMDGLENEYNPWFHTPMPMVGQVPHRWEKTSGTDRMFFDADQHLFPREIEWECFIEQTQTEAQSGSFDSTYDPLEVPECCVPASPQFSLSDTADEFDEYIFNTHDTSNWALPPSHSPKWGEGSGELQRNRCLQR
jgi:hypothetical protein